MIKRISLAIALVIVMAVVAVNLTVFKPPVMPAADGKYISLRGKDIHYVEQPGEGIPVVMLHGLPGTDKDFDPLIAKLPGAHVFAIDRPGFGWSRGGWMPYQDQIDLVHDFVTQLKIGPVILVGWSFGGSLALGVAHRYPHDIAKMVLIAPAAGGMKSEVMSLFQARYLEFSQLPVVKSVVKYTFGNLALRVTSHFGVRRAFEPGPVDPTYEARLVAVTLTPGNIDAYAHELLEVDQTMQWLDDKVPEIRVPSVLVAAGDDRLVPIMYTQRLAATLPGVKSVVVSGSHMIPYTHPDVVAAEITNALAGA